MGDLKFEWMTKQSEPIIQPMKCRKMLLAGNVKLLSCHKHHWCSRLDRQTRARASTAVLACVPRVELLGTCVRALAPDCQVTEARTVSSRWLRQIAGRPSGLQATVLSFIERGSSYGQGLAGKTHGHEHAHLQTGVAKPVELGCLVTVGSRTITTRRRELCGCWCQRRDGAESPAVWSWY